MPLGRLLNRDASANVDEPHNGGVPIVLTASVIEMSDFNNLKVFGLRAGRSINFIHKFFRLGLGALTLGLMHL